MVALGQTAGTIDVLDLRGPMSDYTSDFVLERLAAAESEGVVLVVLQIDSPGTLTDATEMVEAVMSAAVPVVAWVGDAPAVAYGSAYALAQATDLMVVSPGSSVGYGDELTSIGSPAANETTLVDVGGQFETSPALGELLVSLDEVTLETAAGPVQLDTAETFTTEDGQERTRVVPQVRFSEPNLLARTMSLPLRPEAVFFFLTVGLAFVAFEMYAVGPGVAAATAAAPLFLAGYGLTVLPIGWGLWLVLFSMWLLTADFQRGGFGILSYIATGLLFLGGMFITDTRPEMPPPVLGDSGDCHRYRDVLHVCHVHGGAVPFHLVHHWA